MKEQEQIETAQTPAIQLCQVVVKKEEQQEEEESQEEPFLIN
jgi:hypothetical protein